MRRHGCTWVMLHDDVTIPIAGRGGEGAIYRLNTALANRTGNGIRYYNATVHPVPASEFNGQNSKLCTRLLANRLRR